MGFTLIELIVVLAIVSILLAAAAPSATNVLPRWRLKSAAIDLFSNLQLAKIAAIRRGVACRVTYQEGRYELSLPATGMVLKRVNLKDYGSGVQFKGPAPEFRDYSRSTITFNTRGLSNAGYAYLSSAAGDVHYRVGPTSFGVIKLQKLNGNKWQ